MIRLITHNDLDGSSCAIVANFYFGRENTFISHENHNTITDRTKNVIDRHEDYEQIFFTDICPLETELILLSKINNVHVVDHHASQSDMADKFDFITLDLNKCGGLLFYWYLIENFNFKRNKGLEDFLILVDTFDRWVTDDPKLKERADDLGRLFNFYGSDWFENKRNFNEFTTNNESELERHILNVIKNKEEIYFKKMMKEITPFPFDGYMFGFSFATNNSPIFKDEVTKTGLYDGIIVPFVDGDSVSIYGSEGMDVSKYCKAVGGGGHPQASGFSYSFKDKIKEIVRDVLEKGLKKV